MVEDDEVDQAQAGYNSLENPIGIETMAGSWKAAAELAGYNSLENPIGIETIA